jgi:tetratricopeptide (TPR) repeat protein
MAAAEALSEDWNAAFQAVLERLWTDTAAAASASASISSPSSSHFPLNNKVPADSTGERASQPSRSAENFGPAGEERDGVLDSNSVAGQQREREGNEHNRTRRLSSESNLAAARALRGLSERFARAAGAFAADIVAQHMASFASSSSASSSSPPDSRKFDKSVFGGVAGGEKYARRGEFLFAKFAVDSHGLYGGDEFAAKAAVHEFSSLAQILECRVRGLHVPLVCVVDFLGFRIVVEGILPIVAAAAPVSPSGGNSADGYQTLGSTASLSSDSSSSSSTSASPSSSENDEERVGDDRRHRRDIGATNAPGYDVSVVGPAGRAPRGYDAAVVGASSSSQFLEPLVPRRVENAAEKTTLVCGSADGGHSIFNSDAAAAARVASAGKLLNLAPHYIHNWTRTQRALVHLAVDCETHVGTDGRTYIVDAARAFPPASRWAEDTLIAKEPCPELLAAYQRSEERRMQQMAKERDAGRLLAPVVRDPGLGPDPNRKGVFLYELLRPELVRECPEPLCSDAFSAFLVVNKEDHEAAVHGAMRRLGQNIAQLARDLDKRSPADLDAAELVSAMHRRGVNIRYAGILRLRTRARVARAVLLAEMVARATKNVLRMHMRSLKNPSLFEDHKLICQYFNLLFGHSRKVDLYWRTAAKESLLRRFPMSLSEEEEAPSFDLRQSADLVVLFDRLSLLLGLVWRHDVRGFLVFRDVAAAAAAATPGQMPRGRPSLVETLLPDIHLTQVIPRVRSMHRVSFEEATALSKQAIAESSSCSSLVDSLFDAAEEKYRESTERKPDNYRGYHNWGLSLQTRAVTLLPKSTGRLSAAQVKTVRRALSLLSEAQDKFSRAAEGGGPGAWLSWCLVANALVERAQTMERFAERGIDLRFTDTDENVLGFVDPVNLVEKAVEHYNRSHQTLEQSRPSQQSERLQKDEFQLLYNWAGALLTRAAMLGREADHSQEKVCELFEEAGSRYEAALALSPNDQRCNRNFAVALSKWAREEFALSPDRAEGIYEKAFVQFEKTSSLDEFDAGVWYNWGNALSQYARFLHERISRSGGRHPSAASPSSSSSGPRTCVCDLIVASFGKYQRVSVAERSRGNGSFALTREALYNWCKALVLGAHQHNSWRNLRRSRVNDMVHNHETALAMSISALGDALCVFAETPVQIGGEPVVQLSPPSSLALRALKSLRLSSRIKRAKQICEAATVVLGKLRPGSADARARYLAANSASVDISSLNLTETLSGDTDPSMPTIVASPMRHDFHGDTVVDGSLVSDSTEPESAGDSHTEDDDESYSSDRSGGHIGYVDTL